MKHKSNVINTIVTVCCETIRTELQKNFKAKFSFRKSINDSSFEREKNRPFPRGIENRWNTVWNSFVTRNISIR